MRNALVKLQSTVLISATADGPAQDRAGIDTNLFQYIFSSEWDTALSFVVGCPFTPNTKCPEQEATSGARP
jgi:hypothetical protein